MRKIKLDTRCRRGNVLTLAAFLHNCSGMWIPSEETNHEQCEEEENPSIFKDVGGNRRERKRKKRRRRSRRRRRRGKHKNKERRKTRMMVRLSKRWKGCPLGRRQEYEEKRRETAMSKR